MCISCFFLLLRSIPWCGTLRGLFSMLLRLDHLSSTVPFSRVLSVVLWPESWVLFILFCHSLTTAESRAWSKCRDASIAEEWPQVLWPKRKFPLPQFSAFATPTVTVAANRALELPGDQDAKEQREIKVKWIFSALSEFRDFSLLPDDCLQVTWYLTSSLGYIGGGKVGHRVEHSPSVWSYFAFWFPSLILLLLLTYFSLTFKLCGVAPKHHLFILGQTFSQCWGKYLRVL